MPTINVAMERSLRGGFLDLLSASLRPALGRRDEITSIPGQIESVQTAFSSWGNCMQAAFCKWPVIALIIVGGLIVFSVVWCMARCLCCGMSCCCECFYCLKCCGDCCGCCDTPRGTPHKYLDDPYGPGPSSAKQGYRSEAPMGLPPARVAGPPQYAEFDVSKKGNEDALPAMPNWENAGSKKVLLDGDDAVEMDQLAKPEGSAQTLPLMTGAGTSPSPASPARSPDPYAAHDMYAASGGYVSAGAGSSDPYAQSEEAYRHNPAGPAGYGPSSSSLATDQSYGAAAGGMGPGRRSPRAMQEQQGYGNDGYGQGAMDPRYPPSAQQQSGNYDGYGRPPPPRQGSYDSYGRGGPPAGRGMGQNRPPPRGPPGPNRGGGGYPPEGARRSPRPPQGDYGYGNYGNNSNQGQYGSQPQRQYSSDSTRPFARPDMQHQYSQDGQPPESPSSLLNNAGFDFNSGYSRPQTAGENDSGSRRTPAPPQESSAYPGFKAYRPTTGGGRQQDGWSGL